MPVSVPSRSFAGRASRAAIVALASAGLVMAAGAAPASAAERPPVGIGGTYAQIQTHWTGAPTDVKSVGVLRADGSVSTCIPIDTFTTGGWAFKVIDLHSRGVFTLASYAGSGCRVGDYFIGSKGTIDTRASGKFTVYATRAPKSTP